MTAPKQTLTEHLTALRSCLIRSIISLAITTALTAIFSKDIFSILQKPLLEAMGPDNHFVSISPLEGIITYLKVAFLSAFFISSPFILYQIWLFIAPALYVHEKRFAAGFVFFTSTFFIGGAWFGYAIIFPVGFHFFVATLDKTNILFLPSMEDYFNFISRMLLTFGLVFESPLFIFILNRVGILPLKTLKKVRRYVLVLIFLIAGILTPGPDMLSQFLLAVPLLALYEIAIIFYLFFR